jgi:RNA polymerase sigma factor (sigma-70 family)
MAASRESAASAGEALATLCEMYWPPLYAYARRCGFSVEEAEDLTQGFFVQFIERRDVAVADPGRGRFRSFLLTSFKHYASNQRQRNRALKRGGAYQQSSLDVEAVEHRYAAELSTTLTPEALFERHWALSLLDRSTAALRSECAAAGKELVFTHLQGFLGGERSPGGYAHVAEALGTTEGAIKVTVHRLRRRLREILKEHVAATVSDDAEIEDELRHLMSVLGR